MIAAVYDFMKYKMDDLLHSSGGPGGVCYDSLEYGAKCSQL